jgi:hypothetical protein
MERSTARRLFAVLAAAAIIIAAEPAAASPVFGPEIYTKVQPNGTPDVYSDTLTIPANGYYAIWFQNGDDGGDRITSGSVVIGTTTVASDVQFQAPREFFSRVLYLKSGDVPLTVTLNQPEPGAYVGLAITPIAEKFDLTVGRLLLPYADATDTSLVLKNGSHHHNRRFRILYYDAAGALQASSDRLTLGPRANTAGTATSFITSGSWTSGSIEVFWAGRGGARVFGTATTIDPSSSVKSLLELEHAGYRSREFYRAMNQ